MASCSGCDDEGKGDIRAAVNPELEVVPEALSFSAATVDRSETQSVLIRNVGKGDLTGFSFRIDQNGDTFSYVAPDIGALGENQEVEMEVTYQPNDSTPDSGTLIITASHGQRATVQLTSLPPQRLLQCEPTPIAFGAVPVGDSKPMSVDVVNIGALPATVTQFNLEFGVDIAITDEPGLPQELRPDDRTTLQITFSPTAGGAANDKLRILIDESGDFFECAITASTPLAEMDIAPAQVNFGNVPEGQTVVETLTVRSTGSADLEFRGAELLFGTSPDFEVLDSPAEPLILTPGQSTTIDIAYTAGEDLANGTAIFFSNGLNTSEVAVPLLGRPSRPEIVVAPGSIDLGQVAQNLTVSRVMTIFNNGAEDLNIESMTYTGSGDISIRADAAFPPTTGGSAVIPAMGTPVDVVVEYHPSDIGTDQGEITFISNDTRNSPLVIPVVGTGLEQGSCELQVNPSPKVDFGLVTRGSNRIVPVLFRNVGAGLCTFRGASAQGILNQSFSVAGASRSNGDSLMPGEEMVVEVDYHPTVVNFANNGTFEATFQDPNNPGDITCGMGAFCANNPGSFECTFTQYAPCSLQLEGYSGISDIAVIPGTVDFGLVTIGCASQAQNVTVYNTGTADLQIRDIYLDPACSDEFELRGVPAALPMNVEASSPIAVQVIYHPTDMGEDQCTLIIESDASESAPILRVPLKGEGTNVSHQVDVFHQVSGREVDVLFVIDGSGSMSEEQTNVSNNLDDFMRTAELRNNEFQIGVTHVDVGETIRGYDAGDLIGDPPFLTPSDGDITAEFADRVDMNGGGIQEAGLEAARLALSDPRITNTGLSCADCSDPYACIDGVCGGRNMGFLREDASLEIVIVSDEEDQSTATPDFYVDFFQSIHGFRNNALLHVSVIVGADSSGNAANCPSGPNPTADAGRRYAQVANATGGTVGSICSSDFGPYLEDIGNRAFGLRLEFFLSRVAEPASVEVRVDGDPRTSGWFYDAETNSVVFEQTTVPQPGQTIEVEYEAACF